MTRPARVVVRALPSAPLVAGLLCAALLGGFAHARSLKGQSFPDEIEVQGHQLVLNGLGVREATMFKVDVYVAGLYLKSRAEDGAAILKADEPWRLELKFVRDVEKEKLIEAWEEGFGKTAKGKEAAGRKQLNGSMADVVKGDVMTFTYLPGAGVEVAVKGKKKGVVKGASFAKAFLAIWLGSDPPNASLKAGLLGR